MILILIIYFLYGLLYIFKSSFCIDGVRYFCLFDDSMISMRYAKNLVEFGQLVWNKGEFVEGFTNPLWTLYMALLHLLPMHPSKYPFLIQLSCLFIAMFNIHIVGKISVLLTKSNLVKVASMILTGFYLPLNNWILQGTEIGIITLLINILIYLVLTGKINILFYFLIAIIPTVRLDTILPIFIILLFCFFYKIPSKKIIFSVVFLFISCVLQTFLRYWYYGELLPNTYYLKLSGYPEFLRITRGLYTTLEFIWNFPAVLFCLPFFCSFFKKDKNLLLLSFVLLGQIFYSIYVGGDAWQWINYGSDRFISIAMPCFFVIFSISASWLLIEKIKKYKKLIFWGFIFLSLFSFNRINGIFSWAEFLLIRKPMLTSERTDMVKIALSIKKLTKPQAKIALSAAGALGYYVERYCIDVLGKCDKKIARLKAHIEGSSFYKFISFNPGHNKWDFEYSYRLLKPDVIAHLWVKDKQKQLKILKEEGYIPLKLKGYYRDYTVYIKKSSNLLVFLF